MQVTDLTRGNILLQIIKLAVPIIGGSFVQMLYNLTDVFWLGKLGADAVTAVGVVGYLIWFSMSLVLLPKIGVEIGISQAIGRKDTSAIKSVFVNSLNITLLLSALLLVPVLIEPKIVLNIFNLGNQMVEGLAVEYLELTIIGLPFMLANVIFTGAYTGLGNSKIPFYINSVGLALNIILDPILIHGYGDIIPALGVRGAAIASIVSQFSVFIVFLFYLRKNQNISIKLKYLVQKVDNEKIKFIVRVGLPIASQSLLFAIFAMTIARIVTFWGTDTLAVISIGANVEAVSWMTAYGFATALGTFVGQNYGAEQWRRIKKGFAYTLLLSSSIGFGATILFYIFPGYIFRLFVDDIHVVQMGVDYLKIVAISQVFMCLEFTATGVFNGIGKTLPPSIAGIGFNGVRVVGVFISTQLDVLNGVWWSISLSSILKGVFVLIWLIFELKRRDDVKLSSSVKSFARFLMCRLHQDFFEKFK